MRIFKILTISLLLIVLIGCAVSCDRENDSPSEDVYYTVTFNSAGGTSVDSVRVLGGSMIAQPADPQKEGYIFNGWYNGARDWNFGFHTVTSDVTLTARWIDASSLFEYVAEDGEITLTKYKGVIESLRIPDINAGIPVVSIGEGAFDGTDAEKTKEIIIGDNIKHIGDSAFYECDGISIKVEGKPEYIGEKAFYKCDMLSSISFGEGAQAVEYKAFYGCVSLKSVTLSSTVTEISENAFEGCTSLQTITLYDSLKTVSDSAFLDCSALAAIYYYGDPQKWDAVEINDGNNGNVSFRGAGFYIYSEDKPADSSDVEYWHFDKNGNIRIW